MSWGRRLALVLTVAWLAFLSSCSALDPYAECDAIEMSYSTRIAQFTDDDLRWSGMVLSKSRVNGPCACPADRDEAGQVCGDRSAYSRTGGSMPVCDPYAIPAAHFPLIRRRLLGETMPVSCGGRGITSLLRPVGS